MDSGQQKKQNARIERLKVQNRTLRENLTAVKKEKGLLLKALEESHALIKKNPVAAFIVQQGKITQVNDTVRGELGYSNEELLNRSFLDLVHSDSLEQATRLNRRMFSGKPVPDYYETYLMGKDGEKQLFEIRTRKIRYQGRRAFLVNMIGLKHREQKEIQRCRHEKTEALSRMAAGLSQQMAECLAILDKEPLPNQIIESHIDKEFSEYLRMIEIIKEKGAIICENLATLAGLVQDKSDAVLFDLKKLVQNALGSTRPIWKDPSTSGGAQINVKTYLRNLVPIKGDSTKIQHVLASMMLNAIEALPNGGEIYLTTEEDSGFAYVYIQDNGVGIPGNILGKIFDPFFTTKNDSRLGLGLSLAQSIVVQHEGEIEVLSNEGQGTTFIIKLPLAKKPPSSKTKASKNTIKDSHILIISGGDILKDLLWQLLASKGARVSLASTGREGLKLMKKKCFDLVIVDLRKSYLKSSKIIARLKKMEQSIPIVLVSDDEKGRSQNLLKDLGADLVIGRPLDADKTLSLVSIALASR